MLYLKIITEFMETLDIKLIEIVNKLENVINELEEIKLYGEKIGTSTPFLYI